MCGGGKRNRQNVEKKRGGGVRENDIVIHPTLCHKLGMKDAELQAHSLPWVRYCSSNKVNNCFTVMHTLVLLEAKLPSCRSCHCGTLLPTGESEEIVVKISQYSHQSATRRRLSLVIPIK